MREWFARLFCKWGWCGACELHSTADGIGGRCLRCGNTHGWMTRDELRALADRDAAELAGDWAMLGDDFSRAAQKLKQRQVR